MSQLQDQLDILIDVIERIVSEFDELSAQSDGVAGYHLNGDIATWEEIKRGGRYECLGSIDYAAELIAKMKGGAA